MKESKGKCEYDEKNGRFIDRTGSSGNEPGY